jgi:hypothetical protein
MLTILCAVITGFTIACLQLAWLAHMWCAVVAPSVGILACHGDMLVSLGIAI